ncbi:hypothetical protein MFORT_28189 [Mycolicibacterium fortuitum subsp. fortuitum DSM 46621 = ATCC 6841 = JCM 6387]|uniref:Uncharacterized protein n=1 Tax=Mycolicibacterium fortuitum subsp. fortuitum DSM 46621 = ATCC 6841 = JCM 6387 TaxID=1214102 RepID=K0V5Q1_MYCFO|nr:hypothetical protein MFORT_28189 [Mycolicibacterium fortuitum subsp. fortuitum DSM 46621 = ATCC 6841 = JCM 6387]
MNRGDQRRIRVWHQSCDVEHLPSMAGYPKVVAEHGFGGGRSEQDDDLRGNRFKFGDDPRTACLDLGSTGGLVDTALAALVGGELEVLHGVGQIELVAVDLGCGQGLVQDTAGRTDEGGSRAVLPVTRLLTDQHHPG